MANDITEIIGILKSEAVERCRRRIQQAAEKRDGCVKRAKSGVSEYGITSAFKRRHGL
jgi:hypothetical protein